MIEDVYEPLARYRDEFREKFAALAREKFKELAKRMEAGEDFYAILKSTESQQREYCFTRLYELTGKEYDYWMELWLHGPEAVK